MASYSSAGTREQAPHETESTETPQTTTAQTTKRPQRTETARITRTAAIVNTLKQRALSVLYDKSVDAQSRAVIRYALETNDPWLAELVRRAEKGEDIVDSIEQLARESA